MTSSDDPKKLTVSKMDAAMRQLDTAIRLWFEDADPVSIHTLVGAAYQIIHDTNKKRGGKDLLFDAEFIKDEHRKTVREFLRKDFMFFKHADHDTHEVTEFVPLGSILFMTIGIQTLRNLGIRTSDVQNVYASYMALTYPQYIADDYRAKLMASVPVEYLAEIRKMSKHDYFEMALQALALLRAKGKYH